MPTGLLLFALLMSSASPSRTNLTSTRPDRSPMRYQQLGKTGLEVSAVSFGTAPLGDMFGTADEKDALITVRRAIDLGINFFDSSPYYGNGLAERRLGTAVRGHRDEVVIGTKAGRYGVDEFDFSPKRIRESLHE